MLHTTIGNVGHLCIIISFVTSVISAFGYFKSLQIKNLEEQESWKKFSRYSFYLHGLSIVGVIVALYSIIYNHYFEYQYAWSHSSIALPVYYIVSCFWEGQEGSFLLWIFWHALLGLILIKTNRKWEAPLMVVFATVQAFLCSMILGIVLPLIDFKIGSSPFLLMREAMPDLPVWKMNPNFVPEDGRGLNPLLQNYWMVIHPPTLFLGFATTLIPFAYAIAGLWRGEYKEWIRPALPWSLFSAAVLGIGIIMGAYWAYETLNFGGYWNWDPVENASFVPWLVLVAAIHCMIIYKTNESALRISFILVITSFILVLYSTFLNRSGVLGEASVHSFTDLGLSGQLLLYLLFFLVGAVGLLIYRWKNIPTEEQEASVYSREFWIFIGATALCLSSFQIIAATSLPVYNKIVEALGFVSKLAPPADAPTYYSKFQLWFAAAVAILTGTGQYFWWKKIKKENISQHFLTPALVSLILTSLGILATTKLELGDFFSNPTYIALLFACIYAFVTNGTILFNIARGNYKLSGGAVTHIGFAMMLFGILYSSGYSKVVSINTSGFAISNKDEAFTKNNDKENKENVVLWLNTPLEMGKYTLTYKGVRVEGRELPEYVRPELVELIENDFHAVALQDIEQQGKKYYAKGDTLPVFPENKYYEIDFRDKDGKVTTLYPRAQINKKMGNAFSPDLKHSALGDLYTYVALAPNLDEKEWSKTEKFTVAVKDTFFLNDYVAVLDEVKRVTEFEGKPLGPQDAAVQARILISGKEAIPHEIKPVFVIRDGMVAMPPVENAEAGVRARFVSVDPQTGKFTFDINTTQRDFIILKAIEKPLVNILWIGTIILSIGFVMATIRRYREFKLMRDKGF
ncbi:cytochrome c biogenesis protein CcsA [Cellulophaga sp. BC115SP]|uniref:cytochrome c biogenesis protein CcsA n=1 Tax=Cellulophaga sp. BC115SP TaxID=2683263 RepID=UPI001411DB60|nr:cytochrome c biogenesis protein CcsA [Cellulophaga sp. BC115SP]NBB27476.1 cytochrome C biogenesis protein [Cellulophaga sp. BC115SP]